eukprot:6488804-Alexandrium_andersonii.AAC.1
MDDASIEDITNFRAADSDTASAVPEVSGGRRAGPGGQTYRDDVTGGQLWTRSWSRRLAPRRF